MLPNNTLELSRYQRGPRLAAVVAGRSTGSLGVTLKCRH